MKLGIQPPTLDHLPPIHQPSSQCTQVVFFFTISIIANNFNVTMNAHRTLPPLGNLLARPSKPQSILDRVLEKTVPSYNPKEIFPWFKLPRNLQMMVFQSRHHRPSQLRACTLQVRLGLQGLAARL